MSAEHDLLRSVFAYCQSYFSACGLPEKITIKFRDKRKIELPIPPMVPTSREPDELELDIIATLTEAGQRLTTTQLLSSMERSGRIHGESTVKNRLAQLVRAGVLSNDPSARPPGYQVAFPPAT